MGAHPEPGDGKADAYIFPGQGFQAVGMGSDVYGASPAARRVFQETDAALGFSLSAIVLEGPAEVLARTENAQPAILCVSIAYLRALEEQLEPGHAPAPRFVAGHSLGEYTALVAAGAMDLASGLRLVRRRGELMQEASDRTPSGMVALLGLDQETVEALCQRSGVQLANVNSPTQMVVAGPAGALETASAMAKALGARRVVPLEVSGAFHTELMRPAQAGMDQALETVPLGLPAMPVVANTTALPLVTADALRKELVQQMCACVRWQQSIEYMVSQGVTRFVEIGPGQVLTGLVRSIHREAEAVAVGRLDALAGLAVS